MFSIMSSASGAASAYGLAKRCPAHGHLDLIRENRTCPDNSVLGWPRAAGSEALGRPNSTCVRPRRHWLPFFPSHLTSSGPPVDRTGAPPPRHDIAVREGAMNTATPITAAKVIATLRAHGPALRSAGIRALSLFGSVEHRGAWPDSDIDFAGNSTRRRRGSPP